MSDAARNSYATRKECFKRCKVQHERHGWVLYCYICEGIIVPSTTKWEAEHVIPMAFGGTETMPVHPHCHKPKTAKDLGDIAKGKRVYDQTYGIKRSKGSFRNQKWKRKVSGETVPR